MTVNRGGGDIPQSMIPADPVLIREAINRLPNWNLWQMAQEAGVIDLVIHYLDSVVAKLPEGAMLPAAEVEAAIRKALLGGNAYEIIAQKAIEQLLTALQTGKGPVEHDDSAMA